VHKDFSCVPKGFCPPLVTSSGRQGPGAPRGTDTGLAGEGSRNNIKIYILILLKIYISNWTGPARDPQMPAAPNRPYNQVHGHRPFSGDGTGPYHHPGAILGNTWRRISNKRGRIGARPRAELAQRRIWRAVIRICGSPPGTREILTKGVRNENSPVWRRFWCWDLCEIYGFVAPEAKTKRSTRQF